MVGEESKIQLLSKYQRIWEGWGEREGIKKQDWVDLAKGEVWMAAQLYRSKPFLLFRGEKNVNGGNRLWDSSLRRNKKEKKGGQEK